MTMAMSSSEVKTRLFAEKHLKFLKMLFIKIIFILFNRM